MDDISGEQNAITYEQMMELLDVLLVRPDNAASASPSYDAILDAIRSRLQAAKKAEAMIKAQAEEINGLREDMFDEALDANARGRATGLFEAAQAIEDAEHFHQLDQHSLVQQLRAFARKQYPDKELKCEECGQSLDECCKHPPVRPGIGVEAAR